MLNKYFNKGAPGEQRVYEDIVIEAIQAYGFEVYYLPRKLRREDKILGEDTLSYFDIAIPIEVYIENFDGPEGDSEIIARFGLELRDSYTFRISKRRWEQEVGRLGLNIVETRPNEGDLIWIEYGSQSREIFEIKFVEHEKPFYQLNQITTYDLRCEMYQYSNELMMTGVPEIDSISSEVAIDSLLFKLITEDDKQIITEKGQLITAEHWSQENQEKNKYATNSEFLEEAKGIVNFDPNDPFGEKGC